MRFTKSLLIVLALAFCAAPLFAGGAGEGRRNPDRDLKKAAGAPLTKEERTIADFVFGFYAVRYGYAFDGSNLSEALGKMSPEEYQNAVNQAAKMAKSPVAKGFIKAGKAGEKMLKAMIVSTEEAAKATGAWIDQKSAEYDKSRK